MPTWIRVKIIWMLLLCGMVWAVSAQSVKITGEGSGETELIATQIAIMNLVNQIEVKVSLRSGSANITESQGANGVSNDFAAISDVLIESRVSLLGLRFETVSPAKQGLPYKVKATINPADSIASYVVALNDQTKQIALVKTQADNQPAGSREPYLRVLKQAVDDFSKYRSIALILGAKEKDLPVLPLSQAEVAARLRSELGLMNSIDRVAKAISDGVAVVSRSLKAPLSVQSPLSADGSVHEAFSNAVRNRIAGALVAAGLGVSASPDNSYILTGNFTILQNAQGKFDGIDLNYQLIDRTNPRNLRILQSVNVKVLPEALSFYGFF